jgi:hypothetical protein
MVGPEERPLHPALRRSSLALAVLTAIAASALLLAGRPAVRPSPAPDAAAPLRSPPLPGLAFELNAGQYDARARYVARSRGGTVFLTADGAVLSLPADAALGLPAAALGLRVVGGATADVQGLERLPGVVNHLVGRDESRWRRGVPTFARVESRGLLPGADLAFYGAEGGLEYDVIVAAGVDPSAVRIAFDGADRVEVTESGDLRIAIGAREVVQRRPRVYQEVDGQRRDLGAAYVVERGGEVAVRVEGRDPSRALVIDPVVVWSTYLSGTLNDWVADVASDSSGDLLAVGRVTSIDFPRTPGVYAPNLLGASDCFVSRLSASGKSLIASTYFGGTGSDDCRAVFSLGASGVVVAGNTDSVDFPSKSGAVQPSLGGSSDGFVGLLLPDLSERVWMTYLGGSGAEFLRGARLSNQGDVLVWGDTASANFPTTAGTVGTTLSGLSDGFIASFSSALGSRTWATLLGGPGQESIAAIRQNSANVIFAVGYSTTTTTGWPASFSPGGHADGDGFIARLTSNATNVLSFDFIGGGTGRDEALGLGLDINNNTCVTGVAQSPGSFPVTGGVAQPAFGGGSSDAFLLVLNGSMLPQATTYLGGSGDEWAVACGFDPSGDVWAAGGTQSANFPGASGTGNLFYARTDGALARPFASALTGGSDLTIQLFAVRDLGGDLVYAGSTAPSGSFPITPGAYQSTSNATNAGFLLALRTYPFATQVTPSTISSVTGGTITFTGGNWTASPKVDLCSTGSFLPCIVIDASHLSCTAAPHAPTGCTPRLEYAGTPSGYILASFSYAAPPGVRRSTRPAAAAATR